MKPVKVRIFTNFSVLNTSMFLGRSIEEFKTQNIDIVFNKSGNADLVLVVNAVASPRWVVVPKGRVIKVLQEPMFPNSISGLFTYHHSRIYDQILTHSPSISDPRQLESIPLIGTFVDPTEADLKNYLNKTKNISIIASTRASLQGHRLRLQFINKLLDRYPDLILHTYGRGRVKELASKIDGLIDYRFSIAIENSRSPSYITEKFYDCIVTGCVPLYYGAPNVEDYFPSDSFIPLPIDNPEECFKIISDLTETEYLRRVPSLIAARSLIRDKYSIGALLMNYISDFEKTSRDKKKFVFLLRIDGFLCLIQKFGITNYMNRLIPLRRLWIDSDAHRPSVRRKPRHQEQS